MHPFVCVKTFSFFLIICPFVGGIAPPAPLPSFMTSPAGTPSKVPAAPSSPSTQIPASPVSLPTSPPVSTSVTPSVPSPVQSEVTGSPVESSVGNPGVQVGSPGPVTDVKPSPVRPSPVRPMVSLQSVTPPGIHNTVFHLFECCGRKLWNKWTRMYYYLP